MFSITECLRFQKSSLDRLLDDAPISSVRSSDRKEQQFLIKAILSEREFFINLIQNIISKVLTKSIQFADGHQTERNYGKQYFKDPAPNSTQS